MKGHQAQQHPHPHHELSELRLQILGGGGHLPHTPCSWQRDSP